MPTSLIAFVIDLSVFLLIARHSTSKLDFALTSALVRNCFPLESQTFKRLSCLSRLGIVEASFTVLSLLKTLSDS